MIWITEAEYIREYKIRLVFNTGAEGIADLEDVLKNDKREIFRLTAKPGNFTKFRVEADTLVWDTGLDLAPEFLFDCVKLGEMVKG
ncbi:MAG: hypothetical protein A2Y33_05350 [Spirochaetes bacterium GWF1_51_8]|nr:MAG: hypothetical protein A2Y33_05350 [Spirochaetes bacterium GWF1_51_8]